MKGDVLVRGLVRRRRELTGEIEALVSRIEALRDDVRALDQVLLLFRPDMQPDAIPALHYRPRPDWAKHGEIARGILDVMRDAGPLGCVEITRRLMAARDADPDSYSAFSKRVSRSLYKMRARSLVASARDGGRLVWEIARSA